MADITNRTLERKHAKRTFTDEAKGQSLEYDAFYVIVAGIYVRLRPADSTAKELLLNYYNQK